MFDDRKSSRLPRVAGIAVLVAAVAFGSGVYVGRNSQPAAKDEAAGGTFQQLATDVGHVGVAAGQKLMQPVQDATLKALDGISQDFQRKEAERRAKLAADREARTPKAYRWKDKDGAWHLSDNPPADDVAVEVIPVTIR